MKACILIRVKPGNAEAVAKRIGKVKGVSFAAPVFGQADVVALAEARSFEHMRDLAAAIAKTGGVLGSETLPELGALP